MVSVTDQLAVLQEETDALIAVYDPGDRLRYANRAFRSAYFIEDDETPLWRDIMRRNHSAQRGTMIETRDIEVWLASVTSRRGKVASRTIESNLYDGRWLWIVETVRTDGWMMFVGSDITELRRSERTIRQECDRARKASVTDDLTGVSNRRHVIAALDALLERADDRGAEPFTLCLLDLDRFKSVNDIFGHPAGDLVLVSFAQLMRSGIRLKDHFGRVGGEEFLLILPETDAGAARGIIEGVLDEVRRSRPLLAHPDFTYTCSGGLATSRLGDNAQSIYARADQALYCAKREGRNRIVER
ncbi:MULTISPECIES: GGDEF domain-containing protein [unclassified Aureimonas]|uniref:GGDEF domain-containing protein n=1 Tax=unclassified Aureimonas TaxID=2615206 RepID=UPI0006F9959D|nr:MULTISPECIES: sensor domain-containing diguanylate cyclase [unclassified Aureimonas]KQT60745.1 diguanylate cyclase [Aureimonas sp. Leaf460]KQT68875.1 diguanylate cyclase [Aureimonas sp. Leaf427]